MIPSLIHSLMHRIDIPFAQLLLHCLLHLHLHCQNHHQSFAKFLHLSNLLINLKPHTDPFFIGDQSFEFRVGGVGGVFKATGSKTLTWRMMSFFGELWKFSFQRVPKVMLMFVTKGSIYSFNAPFLMDESKLIKK